MMKNWIKRRWFKFWGSPYEHKGVSETPLEEDISISLVLFVLFLWLVSSVTFAILFDSSIAGGILGLGVLFLMQYIHDHPRRERKEERKREEIDFQKRRTRYIKNLEKEVKILGGKLPPVL